MDDCGCSQPESPSNLGQQSKRTEYMKKLDEIYQMKSAITEAVLLDLPEKSKKIARKRLKIKLKKQTDEAK